MNKNGFPDDPINEEKIIDLNVSKEITEIIEKEVETVDNILSEIIIGKEDMEKYRQEINKKHPKQFLEINKK